VGKVDRKVEVRKMKVRKGATNSKRETNKVRMKIARRQE